MQLLIKTLRGKTIVIDAEPTNTILDIKKIIQERENIPLELIRLTNSNILDLEDNKTLKDYKIANNSMFDIRFRARNDIKKYYDIFKNNKSDSQDILQSLINNNFNIEIKIDNQKGEIFPMIISVYDTIQILKDRIAKKESIPQDLQILKLNKIILANDTKRIIDYEIKNRDIIILSIDNKKISINIIFENGKSILIDVKYLDNIKIIRNNENIREQEQYELYFKDNQLDENKTFLDYKIKQGDIIECKKIINTQNKKFVDNKNKEGNNIIDLKKDVNNKIDLEEKIKNLESINKTLSEKITQLEKKLKEMTIKNEKEISIKNQELINKNKEFLTLLSEFENKKLKEMKYKDDLLNKEKEKVKDLNKKLEEFEKLNNKKFQQKEIIDLIKQLNEKEKEIKNLKSNIPFELKNGEKLMTLNFISIDQKIHCSFICKNNDNFTRLENLLYDKYPEYRETENYFLFKGNKINRFKSLDSNNIHNNDIIILNQY